MGAEKLERLEWSENPEFQGAESDFEPDYIEEAIHEAERMAAADPTRLDFYEVMAQLDEEIRSGFAGEV